MITTEVPFSTENWQLATDIGNGGYVSDADINYIESGAARIMEEISRPVEWGVRQYNEFTDNVGEVAERGREFVGDTLDWAGDFLM
jgi:hypothetical protein